MCSDIFKFDCGKKFLSRRRERKLIFLRTEKILPVVGTRPLEILEAALAAFLNATYFVTENHDQQDSSKMFSDRNNPKELSDEAQH